MEELTPEWNGSFEQTEGVKIDWYIDDKIDEQLNALMLTAPTTLLPVVELKEQITLQQHQDGSGRITLPDNFLRPISLQMQGWNRPVTRFIDQTHPLYNAQFCKYTRGGVAKPVAAWITDGSGTSVIDYYSLPESYSPHAIQSFTGILSSDNKPTEYKLHTRLIDMLCYRCAATVYDIMGNHTMAEIMLSHTIL